MSLSAIFSAMKKDKKKPWQNAMLLLDSLGVVPDTRLSTQLGSEFESGEGRSQVRFESFVWSGSGPSWCLFFDVFRWTSSRFLVQVGRLKDFSLTNEDEWRVCQFGVGCFVMAVPLHCLHRAWDGMTCFGNLASRWIPSFCSKQFFVKLFHIPWRIHGTALFTYMKSWILYYFYMVKVG